MKESITMILTIVGIVDIGSCFMSKNKKSFIIRYVVVGILFFNVNIFSDQLINSIFFEMICVGYIIYVITYAIVGVLMAKTRIYSPSSWRAVYFVIYIILAVILRVCCDWLTSLNILPI